MFAFEQAGIVPDILVVGKGFSGGYLPISAAIASEQIYDAFRGHAADMKTFFYGQTFAGNPLAAAVARANLRLFKKNRVTESLAPKIAHFHRELDRHVAPLAAVDEIRRVGVMVGIELTSTPGMREPFDSRLRVGPKIVQEARKRGVIIRPLGNVMVLMPPLVMSEGELSTLVQVTAEAIIQGVKQ